MTPEKFNISPVFVATYWRQYLPTTKLMKKQIIFSPFDRRKTFFLHVFVCVEIDNSIQKGHLHLMEKNNSVASFVAVFRTFHHLNNPWG